MFSGEICGSKPRNFDAAKDRSGRKCTAAVGKAGALVSNRARSVKIQVQR
jgi:hypothetical protein